MTRVLKSLDLVPGDDGFHHSSLEKGWWWVVWRDCFRDSSPEKQAIHPNGVPFRESSLENVMLPHLGRCFHDSSLEKLRSWTYRDVWFSWLESWKGWWWVVWKGGFRDSSPEKQVIHPNGGSFRESSPENSMLPHLGRCFHDSSPEKLGSWTWGWIVFMTLALGGWFRPENHTCLSLSLALYKYIYICMKVCWKPLRVLDMK